MGAKPLEGLFGSASAQMLYYKYWLQESPESRMEHANLRLMSGFARVNLKNIDLIIQNGMAKSILDAAIKQIDISVATAARDTNDDSLLTCIEHSFHILESFASGSRGDDRIILLADSSIIGVLIYDLQFKKKRLAYSPGSDALFFLPFVMLATILQKESLYVQKAVKKGFFKILAVIGSRSKHIEPLKDMEALHEKIRVTLLNIIGRELVYPRMITLISAAVARLSHKQRNQLHDSAFGKHWAMFESLVIERHATLRLCKICEQLATCRSVIPLFYVIRLPW